jgi:putative SOS response-associated peptidase YedK
MCGRFFLKESIEMDEEFGVEERTIELYSNFNVAPMQTTPIIVRNSPNHYELMRWGLVPFWAKDPAIGNRMINARSETIAEKPSFRNALKSRRCIVPASGFFEWKGEGKEKVPYLIHPTREKYFGFAGLYETWKNPETGEELKTYTIITTASTGKMKTLHERIPVMLDDQGRDQWLDKEAEIEKVLDLLHPAPDTTYDMYEISTAVNNPRNNAEELLEPVKHST